MWVYCTKENKGTEYFMAYKKKTDKLKIEKRVLFVSLAGSILVALLEAFMAYSIWL